MQPPDNTEVGLTSRFVCYVKYFCEVDVALDTAALITMASEGKQIQSRRTL